ncbi:MAG: alpha-ketoglutarate-dependent dioxygenase AlkB [Frankiaceae bacterium]
MSGGVAWQASLFDAGPAMPDFSFGALTRLTLDERSWVDYAPGWLTGSDELFSLLLATGSWQQREVTLYDRTVLEPRLTAGWSTDVEAVPAPLAALAGALSHRYGVGFDRIWVNLYRDGADSVAWHGDRNRHLMTRPLVATVSLGARRRFRLRPTGTTRAVRELRPGHGDLVVMGGACQSEWEHTVPKSARVAGARMAVTLRHSRPAPGERWLRQPTSEEPGHAW